ncbi:MAG TPA: hypothetical protein VG795_01560, partial [Acidimicrobiia bacterium]|nr:hypothetical protein [Acidimicrobiia bacterium]
MRRRYQSLVLVASVAAGISGCAGQERAAPREGKQVVVAEFPAEFKPRGVAVDGQGTVYTSGWDGKRFVIAAFPKNGKPTRRPIPCATSEGQVVGMAASLAAAPDGTLFWAQSSQHRVVRIGPDGNGNCYAGTGERGFSGDGGPAAKAQLSAVQSLAYDPEEMALYI